MGNIVYQLQDYAENKYLLEIDVDCLDESQQDQLDKLVGNTPNFFAVLEWITYWKINKNHRIQWTLSTQKSEVIVI